MSEVQESALCIRSSKRGVMKDKIKIVGISIVLILMLGILIGCSSNNDEDSSDDESVGYDLLVGTMEVSWTLQGTYVSAVETIEVRFDGAKVESAIYTIMFENEEYAELYYEVMSNSNLFPNTNFTHSGRTVIEEVTIKDFFLEIMLEETATREEIKRTFEEERVYNSVMRRS